MNKLVACLVRGMRPLGSNMMETIFLALVGVGVLWDLSERRIPNAVTFSMIVGGLAFHFVDQGIAGGLEAVSGAVVGMALLLPVYAMSGMGAGDVKFLGGVGAYLGWKGVFVTFVYMGIFGGIYAIFLLLLNREYARNLLSRMYSGLKSVLLTRKISYAGVSGQGNVPVLCYGLPIGLGALACLAEPYLGITLLGAF